jgi:uncharacterized protein (TIGR02594 family)
MTPFDLAQRFVGEVKEVPGTDDNPLILWFLSLCEPGIGPHDEVPWCSAFMNAMFWLCRLPRSKSARARSWEDIGVSITLAEALPGDVIILRRGTNPLQGHVGFFAGLINADRFRLLSGNVSNAVTIQAFPRADVVGVRRIV